MSQTIKDLTKVFKALANERRLKILKILYSLKGKGISVTDMADQLRLSIKSTSKHLQQIENVGLLRRERRVTSVIYRINITDKRISSLLESRLKSNKSLTNSHE